VTQQDVVRLTQMDKVTVSRAAQGLEKRKLVRRMKHAEDGRSLRLSLAAPGWTIYRRVIPAARALEAEVLTGLGPRELNELKGVLRKLEAAAVRVLARR
jgi:DNA-binding MarR family transcriptional regulator